MSTLRKINKSYQIVVSLGNDEQGKQVRKYKTYRPAPNLTEKQARKEAERQARIFEDNCKCRSEYNENMTLRQLCDWYFETIAPQTLKLSTLDSQKNVIENHILRDLGRFKLREIQVAMLDKHFVMIKNRGVVHQLYRVRKDFDLMEYIKNKGLSAYKLALSGVMSENSLISLCKGETRTTEQFVTAICDFLNLDSEKVFECEYKPLNNNFVKKIQLALSAVFASAVKKQIMRENPMNFVTPPKRQEFQHTALDLEQTEIFLQLLENCQNLSCKYMFKLMLFTGIRSGEARALLHSDINLDTGLMDIGKSIDNKGRVTSPKTNSSRRVISLPQPVCDFLKEYRTLNPLITSSDVFFPNTSGGYMTESVTIANLKRLIKGSNLPQTLTVHSLRHTSASLLISDGNNATTVSALLGHSSTSTTLNVYAHAFKEQQARALEGLALHLDKPDKT
jgi:integrase